MTPQERAEFVADIAAVMMPKQHPAQALSDDEVIALRLLIKKEMQQIAFRQSIIDKTTGALIKTAVTALFGFAVAWFAAHIYRG